MTQTTKEVTDIYIRNGILTARGKAPDPITGIVCDTEFNMNLGGKFDGRTADCKSVA